MTISSVTNSNYVPPANAISPAAIGNVAPDADGDNDGSRVGKANGGPGAFMGAVFQALSQAGVTAGSAQTSSSSGGASTSNPVQALGDFLHSLFTALQSQSGTGAAGGQSGTTGSTPPAQSAQAGQDADGDNDGSDAQGVTAAGGHHHHHGGGIAKIESNLQSLIQQLSSTSDGSSNGTATAGSTTTDAALQQSYTNLLGSLGVSADSSSLGSFLQALSQNLQHLTPVGNVVSTQA